MAQWLISVALLALAAACACLPQPAIDFLAKASTAWLLLATALIVVALPCIAPATQSSRFVWGSNTIASSAKV